MHVFKHGFGTSCAVTAETTYGSDAWQIEGAWQCDIFWLRSEDVCAEFCGGQPSPLVAWLWLEVITLAGHPKLVGCHWSYPVWVGDW